MNTGTLADSEEYHQAWSGYTTQNQKLIKERGLLLIIPVLVLIMKSYHKNLDVWKSDKSHEQYDIDAQGLWKIILLWTTNKEWVFCFVGSSKDLLVLRLIWE